MTRKTGVIEDAIDAVSKMDTLKLLNDEVAADENLVVDDKGSTQVDDVINLDPNDGSGDVEKPKRGRKASLDKEPTKSLNVVIPISDFKRLRFIALSSDRTIKDEIIEMIREKYKYAVSSMKDMLDE